eukprot:gene4290-3063_t
MRVLLLLLALGLQVVVSFTSRTATTALPSSTAATWSRLAMSFDRQGAPRTTNKFQRKFTGVLQQMVHKRERNAAIESIRRDPLIPKVESIVNAAIDRKAGNIIVLRIAEWTEVAQFMIIMEGNSKAQLQAIAASIEERLAASFQETPYVKDGVATSGWMVLDYSDILVHIMTPPTRAFYKLEQRWKDGDVYPIDHLVPPATGAPASTTFGEDDNDRDHDDSNEHISDIVGDYVEETEGNEAGMARRDETDPFWS